MAIDYSKIDISKLDPGKTNLGNTDLQDCSLIAQTFERGAHSTPTEAAVFATIQRSLHNTKSFSSAVGTSLKGYIRHPQEAADENLRQLEKLLTNADVADQEGKTGGEEAPTDHIMQAVKVGEEFTSTLTESFGKSMMDWTQDCIPCKFRIVSFMELHPHVDLLGSLTIDIDAKLGFLGGIGDMLNNFDTYGDFCGMLNFLSFICVPDLQRLIVLLMAMMLLDVPKLDGFINIIQMLIAPIFSPILMSLGSLLDQFVSIVTAPLECVIDSLNQQMQKLGFEMDPSALRKADETMNQLQDKSREIQAGLTGGLGQLNQTIQEAKDAIETKLAFYLDEIKAIMEETSSMGGGYLDSATKKLQTIRMIGFITAIISAVSSGHQACSSDRPPEISEIDNFLDTFLNPNAPFNMWIDDKGEVHIDEKVPNFDVVVNSSTKEDPLPSFGNVFQFEGEDLITPTVAQKTKETIRATAQALSGPTEVILPCRLETEVSEVDKVNKWIEELNQS